MLVSRGGRVSCGGTWLILGGGVVVVGMGMGVGVGVVMGVVVRRIGGVFLGDEWVEKVRFFGLGLRLRLPLWEMTYWLRYFGGWRGERTSIWVGVVVVAEGMREMVLLPVVLRGFRDAV